MAKPKKSRRTPTSSRRNLTLAGFFRALWKSPDLLERFASGKEGRAAVLRQLRVGEADRKLLAEGCVVDIIQALAGVKPGPGADNVVIYSVGDVSCGHPECKAFMASLKNR